MVRGILQWFRRRWRSLLASGGVGLAVGVVALLAIVGLLVGGRDRGLDRETIIPDCRINRIELVVPPRAVLRRAFRVTATPIGTSVKPGHTCEAVATLSSSDPLFIDRPTQRVDLDTNKLEWNVAYNVAKDTATLLRVRIDPVRCASAGTCAWYQERIVHVFRSAGEIRAQTALDEFADKITATVRQDNAVRAGVPSSVTIDLAIPEPATIRDIGNLTITIDSSRYPRDNASTSVERDLDRRVVSFPFEVTPEHARDITPNVGFQVRGRWQDVVLSRDLQLPVRVDVHSDNMVQRNLLAAVSVLVGAVAIRGGLRRRPAKPASE